MHLKNFSLYQPQTGTVQLTPAYDLINTTLVFPNQDELALKLNNKRRDINREDFVCLAQRLNIEVKILDKLIQKYQKCLPKIKEMIESSFVSEALQRQYLDSFITRLHTLTQF